MIVRFTIKINNQRFLNIFENVCANYENLILYANLYIIIKVLNY